jgi:hypothetical protein
MPSQRTASVPYALLACDVFQDELVQFAGDSPPWRAIDYLEMGLHDHPDRLREAVQDAIAGLEGDAEVQTVVLAYGRCGNGLLDVRAGRCPLILPQAHDCVSILLGSSRRHDAVLKETPGAYFYSPGWIRGKRVPGPDRETHLRELYGDRFKDDEDMLRELIEVDRETFEHHNCAAYVSIIDRPEAEDYCKGCAHHLGWRFQRLEGDASFLRDLLDGSWDQERFLTVPPGQCVGADADGNLVAVA